MSASRALLLGTALLAGACVQAADDEEMPELEFLEYLGLWEESDEDWLIFSAADEDDADKRSGPAPEGEEPVENEDEG
jgi:hypothetical protein